MTVTHRNTYSSLPPSFFTSGTGFFLAKFPSDYRRIVQVSPYENDECFEARKAVLRWSASQLNATVASQAWRNGWLEEKAHSRPSKPGKRSATVDSHEGSLPDFGVDPGVCVDAEDSVKKSRPVRPLEHTPDSSEDTAIDETEPPMEFTAEAIDVLPSEDSRDVHLSDATDEPQPSSSATTQETLGPSGEGHPSAVATNANHEDSFEVNTQVTSNQEVTPNQDVPAVTSGPRGDANNRTNTLQERAFHLLKYGQLPHFAPARRDWGKGGIVSFGLGNKDYPWPPQGWQEMDADQRLLSAEFAAMALEFTSVGGFPRLTRSELLDKFNFLVLPGSSKIRRTQEESRRGKSRFYTYQELRRIAVSTTSKKEDDEFVTFYEKGRTPAVTDDIIDGLELLKVPLRLGQ